MRLRGGRGAGRCALHNTIQKHNGEVPPHFGGDVGIPTPCQRHWAKLTTSRESRGGAWKPSGSAQTTPSVVLTEAPSPLPLWSQLPSCRDSKARTWRGSCASQPPRSGSLRRRRGRRRSSACRARHRRVSTAATPPHRAYKGPLKRGRSGYDSEGRVSPSRSDPLSEVAISYIRGRDTGLQPYTESY